MLDTPCDLLMAKPGETIQDWRFRVSANQHIPEQLFNHCYAGLIKVKYAGVRLREVHDWLNCMIPHSDYTWYGSTFYFSKIEHAIQFKLVFSN